MADYFDPSPQAPKRRRTTTYKSSRSVLEDKENDTVEVANTPQVSEQDLEQHASFEDSTYGSKDDSLVEDDRETIELAVAEDIADSTTSGAQSTKRKRVLRTTTPPPDAVESGDENEDHNHAIQPRSSGRERRRPRRYSISPEKPRSRKSVLSEKTGGDKVKSASKVKEKSVVKTQPKGILTPSRREKRVGPRKSVVFDQTNVDLEENLGFRDIENSNKKDLKVVKSQPDLAVSDETNDAPLTPSKKQSKKISATETVSPAVQPQPASEPDYSDIFPEDLDNAEMLPDITGQDEIDNSIIEDDPSILAIKSIILNRLITSSVVSVPVHLKQQYETLHTLLHATVTSGESNSLLLLGARGTGKSSLIESAISDIATEYSDDFHTVRLNGFFQTDDKVALREIWRQLGREMKVDEMESGEHGGSYADTMSSLLSLLSHPDDFAESMDVEYSAARTSKSIIFILDEFDLFTTHPRQTLLYNLFDIAQSKKAPIAVIGCSTRMDVVDCLEKRVKSRFSHRWLHVPSVKTLNGLEEMISSIVSIEADSAIMLKMSKEAESRKSWNEFIQSTFLQSTHVQSLTKRTFYSTKSIPDLLTALYASVATVQLPSTQLIHHPYSTSPSLSTFAQNTLLPLLSTLPSLHLALLIAASRLDTIHNLTTLNFNLVYAHYVELISRSKIQVTASGAFAVGASLRQWNRETAQLAWEDLGSYECIIPVSGMVIGAGSKDTASVVRESVGGEGATVRMWRVDVTLEELTWAVREKWKESGGVRDVLSKWCKEI